MSDTRQKMQSLLAASRQVLGDCALPNGAIVASNTDLPYANPGTSNYHYVWPRDAAFIIYAGKLLGLDLAKPFSTWLLERAESFEELGLFSRRYATHGPWSSSYKEFQPDQSGALLWAFSNVLHTGDSLTIRKALSVTADTLCATWESTHFNSDTFDLWEQFPNNEQNGSFTYSLAACAHGLECAASATPNQPERWQNVAAEMRIALNNNGRPYSRLTGDADQRIDASLLGLIWPFNVAAHDDRLASAVTTIGEKLRAADGIMRFEDDIYDGRIAHAQPVDEGAGTWPLLTCWYAIALCKLGRVNEAREIFERLVDQLPEQWIPEQLLSGGRHGVSPLGWSHAMYVIAYHELGYSNSGS